ncbi:MAG: SLC13 family permease [Armatimonadota bacterium]
MPESPVDDEGEMPAASDAPPMESETIPGRYGLRQRIGLVLGVVLFVGTLVMPTPAGMSLEAKRAAAVGLLMAAWWISQALPIPAVALLPLVLYPALKIMGAKRAAAPYANHNIYLFMGGFFIAMAMQKWGLHRRIALHVIRILGTNPRLVILGFMVATALISMWISDTATTMMMVPIAMAVIAQVVGIERARQPSSQWPTVHANFAAALVLCIAHSSVIGGVGTLIGTPPNIIFAGQFGAGADTQFPGADPVAFSQWMLCGIPVVVLFLPLCWLWITRIGIPVRLERIPGGREVIRRELAQLGRMNRGERITLVVFLLAVAAWMFRAEIDLGGVVIPGWADRLGVEQWGTSSGAENGVADSTVAIAAGLLLFMLPVNLRKSEFVLDWQTAARLPWGILILFGGGFALAASFEATGLSAWLGGILGRLEGAPPLLMIACTCLLLTFLTEVTSNTATASIMMPILGATAVSMGIHPFLLMMPAAMSASCAFMLPVATPPNAIVFGTGYLNIPEMCRTGIGLNLIGVVIITAVTYFITVPVFGIDVQALPTWAH